MPHEADPSVKTPAPVDEAAAEEAKSMAAGRAAGYCWVRNPNRRGRCTRPPDHPTYELHWDWYAHTHWA